MDSDEGAAKKADSDKLRFENILKEKFGNPEFGDLMGSIVDQMLGEIDKDGETDTTKDVTMGKDNPPKGLKDGAHCKVINGRHAGKAGLVRDIQTSKSGYVTITVEQASGVRFKTLAKSVEIRE